MATFLAGWDLFDTEFCADSESGLYFDLRGHTSERWGFHCLLLWSWKGCEIGIIWFCVGGKKQQHFGRSTKLFSFWICFCGVNIKELPKKKTTTIRIEGLEIRDTFEAFKVEQNVSFHKFEGEKGERICPLNDSQSKMAEEINFNGFKIGFPTWIGAHNWSIHIKFPWHHSILLQNLYKICPSPLSKWLRGTV